VYALDRQPLCKVTQIYSCVGRVPSAGGKLHVGVDLELKVREKREFFIDNLLVRNHFIIVMSRWTGLAVWEFEFPFGVDVSDFAQCPSPPPSVLPSSVCARRSNQVLDAPVGVRVLGLCWGHFSSWQCCREEGLAVANRAPYNTTSGRDCVKAHRLCLHRSSSSSPTNATPPARSRSAPLCKVTHIYTV